MGHLNVRFYVAHAMEGLVGLAAGLGLQGAFAERANGTLIVQDHHIRFLREARTRAALHMMAGVLEIGECDARLLQLLIHTGSGELAASFQTVVTHVTAGDGRPFPWATTTRRLAEGLKIAVPASAAPRSLGLEGVSGTASLEAANRHGLIRIGSGAVSPSDCDAFGRMRPEVFIGRVSDGIPGFGAALRAVPGDAAGAQRREGVGGAVLEYRIAYQAWPRAGDRFEIRSGLAAVGDRTQRFVHWMLDSETGRPWATSEAVAIALDLEARKIIPIPVVERAHLESRITPGLAM